MRCGCAVGKVVGVCLVRALYIPCILVWYPKWSLYFILCMFAVLTFTSLSWTSSLLKWALCPTMDELLNLIHLMWWSPFSPLDAVFMNKVNIFLFRKDSCTWPSGHTIHHFIPLCHICFVIPAFCGSFMQYSDYYHTGRRHIHKGSAHYAKKKKSNCVHASERGAQCQPWNIGSIIMW